MRKMKKVLSVLATVVMVAAALTACGGNGKSGSRRHVSGGTQRTAEADEKIHTAVS